MAGWVPTTATLPGRSYAPKRALESLQSWATVVATVANGEDLSRRTSHLGPEHVGNVDRPHPRLLANALPVTRAAAAAAAPFNFRLQCPGFRRQSVGVEIDGHRYQAVLLEYRHHVGDREGRADHQASSGELESLQV